MELVVAIAAKAAEYTVAPIGRQLGYMIFLKSNTDNLKTKVQLVVETRERVQHRIDAARMNGEEIEFDVQNWLSQVDEMVKAANKFYQKDYYSTTGCSIGRCLNILSRYKQSRTAKKMAQVIIEILDKGNFSTVSFRSLPQLSTATFITKEYKALESRTTTLIQIMEKLKDATIQTIGVWGLGGVGKTTIAKQVAKLADECKLFDRVIMVAVTVNPDVRRIQGEIADALGLRFDEETEMGRANRLCHRIQQENSILIIIDDLWGGFELEAIGVLLGDDHKGSKLFLTSRSYDVLKREMGIQVGFRLEVLPEKEGWILFEEMAGNVVQDPNVQPVAIEVVKRCAGLPVLIATVAKALKDERLYAWKDALKQLETFDKEGMHAKVFSALELSYNQLKGHEIKSLLLLIALHGQPSVRKYDLLIICVGLGLLKNVDTLEDARNRLHKLTNDLKASCLLIEDERDKVIIHDVVREAAVSIAAKDQLFHINFDVEASKEWPEMDQVKIFHGLFLSVRHYHCLPEKLEGPELTSLWLDRNDDSFLSLQHETLLKVPDSFFEEMRKLKVLCVSGMVCTPSPPPSLHLLKNLRALYLYKCSLEDITTIGELANLEILSLQNSEIQQLPREIGQLHRLRLLDLEDCNNLKVIPPKVISNLTHLEELNMKDSFTNWEAEGWNTQCSNASLGELTELCHLTRLYIQVPDTSMVPSDFFLFLENVERFTVRIGQRNYFVNSSQYSRILTISFPSSTHSENLIKILPQEVEYLELDGVNDVKNVLYDFNAKGFPQLKCIWVLNNDDLECVINSMSLNLLGPAFPSLEVLVLENLHNLEHICHGPSTVETFCKLRMVDVEMCNILKNMFSFSMIKALSQLEKIKVSNCKSMKEIVSSEREDNLEPKCMDIKFPELRSLKLQGLPALICFCSKERTSPIFGGTYEEITVDAEIKEIDKADNCSSSLPLFNKKVAFPKLETLKLSSINIEKIWNDQILGSACIQNLTKLTIKCCGNLKHLLSFPLARDLVNLKYLELSKCQMLEKILATKESFLEEVLFPNLETMKISHMDNLRTMWHHPITPNSFCKVKRIEVSDCPKVTVIFPSDSVSNFQNLETLEVNDCSRVEEIFALKELHDKKSHAGVTCQLKDLTLCRLPKLKHIWNKDLGGILSILYLQKVYVEDCGNLNYIFPASLAKCLVQLEMLHIDSCGVTEIIAKDEGSRAAIRFLLPQVKYIWLKRLPKIKNFYPDRHTSEWPLLKELYVSECDEIEIFASEVSNYQEDGHEIHCPQLFVGGKPLFLFGKVLFPNLETLTINGMDSLRKVWHNQPITPNYSCKVRSIKISSCMKLVDVFPFSTVRNFQNLERLTVKNCGSVEVIFNLLQQEEALIPNHWGQQYVGSNSPLKLLTLHQLPNLKHIWTNGSEGTVKFKDLQTVIVEQCENLNCIFPASIAKCLMQLEKLEIVSCGVTEIVAKDEGSRAAIRTLFPQVKYVSLKSLPKLRNFYPGTHTWEWPMLKQLHMSICNETEILKSEILEHMEDGLESPFQQLSFGKNPLFLFGKDVHNLEKLVVEGKMAMMILNGQFETDILHNLKGLVLACSDDDSVSFPSIIHQRLSNNAKVLLLTFCSSEVRHDSSLISLLPSSISFQSLVTLKIEFFDGLVNLVTLSTVRSLGQLREIRIKNCEKIEEIILSSEDEEQNVEGDDIAFSQLERLELLCLPNFKSFCSGNYTFQFPSLKKVVAIACPKMEIFSSGVLVAPLLKGVRFNYNSDEEQWKGDLNTTVRQMFMEMEAKGWPKTVRHPLHEKHDLVLGWRSYVCDGCHELGKPWSFLCQRCDFDLHPHCALEANKEVEK